MFDKLLNTAMPLIPVLKIAIKFYTNPWNFSVEELEIFSKIAELRKKWKFTHIFMLLLKFSEK